MARKKESGPSADDFLEASIEPTSGQLARRPDIELNKETARQLFEAVRKNRVLLLPLEKAVELLRLDPSYAKPGHSATLLSSSLQRQLGRMGLKVRVGAVAKGTVLRLALIE